jgi:hypothetical protein
VLPCLAWRARRGAATAKIRSTSTTPPIAAMLSITGAAPGGGGLRLAGIRTGREAHSPQGQRPDQDGGQRQVAVPFTTNCVRGSGRRWRKQSRMRWMTGSLRGSTVCRRRRSPRTRRSWPPDRPYRGGEAPGTGCG